MKSKYFGKTDSLFFGGLGSGSPPEPLPEEVQQQITEMQQQFYPETPLSEFGFIYGVQYNQNNPIYLTVLVYPKTVEPFLWAGASDSNSVDFYNASSYTKRASASGSSYSTSRNMHYLWTPNAPGGKLDRISLFGNFPECRAVDGSTFGIDYTYIG